jgi:two-component system response regulator
MQETPNTRLANILLAEDSLPDVMLFKTKMAAENVHFNLHVVRDGEEAIDYIQAATETAAPDLMILDLNLPHATGIQVLQHVRTNSKTEHIPVIMLSGSDHSCDIQAAMEAGALQYLVKPLTFDSFKQALENIPELFFCEQGNQTSLRFKKDAGLV